MLKTLLNAPLEYLHRTEIDNIMNILHVLEYICRSEKDCSVSDIANNFDVDKSEICKWLEAFVESDYIRKDKITALYYPTLKTVTIGECILNNIRARKSASSETKE
jgi:DNA-binding IclR family transcriptional regulator